MSEHTQIVLSDDDAPSADVPTWFSKRNDGRELEWEVKGELLTDPQHDPRSWSGKSPNIGGRMVDIHAIERSDGEAIAYGTSPVPCPTVASKHASRKTITRKGKPTELVTHRGIPTVRGVADDAALTEAYAHALETEWRKRRAAERHARMVLRANVKRDEARGLRKDGKPYAASKATKNAQKALERATRAVARGPITVETHQRAIVLALGDVRSHLIGANAIDIGKRTDALYGRLGLPALVGADAISYEDIGNETNGEMSYLAMHRCGLTGGDRSIDTVLESVDMLYVSHSDDADMFWHSDDVTLSNVADSGVYLAHTTPPVAKPATRDALPAIVLRGAEKLAQQPDEVTGLVELIAPHTDSTKVWLGHTLITRPSADQEVAPNGKRQRADVERRNAANIGTLEISPTNLTAWRELCDGIGLGEKLIVRTIAGDVHLSHSASDRWNITDHRHTGKNGRPLAWPGVRSADAVAARLA